jgi:hypothetical protein
MASGNFVVGVSAQITNLNQLKNQLEDFKLNKQIEVPIKIKDGERGIKQITTLKNELGQTVTVVKRFDSSGKQVGDSVTKLATNFNKATQSVKPFNGAITKLIQTGAKVAVFSVLASGINAVKDALAGTIDVVKEFDSALTEFKKVSDLRGQELSDYAEKLGEIGAEVGRTTTQMIQASTEFKKGGFTDEESAKLAKVASLYQNIADSELSAGDSASYIISQLKAFNMTADQAIDIIDKTNEVKLFVTSLNCVNFWKAKTFISHANQKPSLI